ncbi:hypothetical protein QCA50_000694 [Cerrena zonata]|uniref:Uncharacterized protein n=1 Tax=Cerrena zonata TaxID=2478898 RepID=A0AAW0GRN7_9APHY
MTNFQSTNPLSREARFSFVLFGFETLRSSHLDSSWHSIVRKIWQIDPAIAVFLAERFHVVAVYAEVCKVVCSNNREVVAIPDALRFLIGDSS